MRHPPDEPHKDRRNRRIVGLGVVVIFALLSVIVFQGIIQYNSQINHHAATIRQDNEILQLITEHSSTLKDIKTLETQVSSVIAGLPAADAKLAQFAVWLEICVGQDHEWNCPAPPIPTS